MTNSSQSISEDKPNVSLFTRRPNEPWALILCLYGDGTVHPQLGAMPLLNSIEIVNLIGIENYKITEKTCFTLYYKSNSIKL